jgi:dihydroorotate dehydrogenase
VGGSVTAYDVLFDRVATRIDPERAHHLGFRAVRAARPVLSRLPVPGTPVHALGLTFPNVLGLAAGFDKNAVGIDALAGLGFGHVEVGTVTGLPQPGNPTPRLFRLTDDRAIVNRMGFNNDGAEVIARRLAARAGSFGGRVVGEERATGAWSFGGRVAGEERATGAGSFGGRVAGEERATGAGSFGGRVAGEERATGAWSFGGRVARREERATGVSRPILGINIGKSKIVPEDEAVGDYVASARLLSPYADYLVVNVSSPNTPGLRNLQAVEKLEPILTAVRDVIDGVPLLVKIAPDLADGDVHAVADLALAIGLDGIIATNTTISRDGLASPDARVEAVGAGGLSGRPLTNRSLEVLRLLRQRVGADLTLIGVGGITTVEEAQDRLDAGADLLQGYTAFIYEGPGWPRRILRGLGG